MDDLTRDTLLAVAQTVRTQAHAPYSKFAVGAAVLDEQGRIHAGCNVENAAYPQGWCAEASAIAAMVAAGGRHILAVAVSAEAAQAVPPCGGCRQKIREFADDSCDIFITGAQGGLRAHHTLGQILPFAFGPQYLNP